MASGTTPEPVPEIRPQGAAILAPAMTTPEATPLLEREAEVAALQEELTRAGAGTGRVTVVEGPGGIGKSRLLGALADRARQQGFRVASARGAELEREFPFG